MNYAGSATDAEEQGGVGVIIVAPAIMAQETIIENKRSAKSKKRKASKPAGRTIYKTC